MTEPVISVEALSKRYRLGTRGRTYRTLRDSLAGLWRPRATAENLKPSGDFWALQEISFELGQGRVLGLIGHNGAGKSTLLKILSRITEPTAGRAVLHGRVGSLLEVGTGFHGELSGRENIFLNGAILGMKRSEIARQFDRIVAFAEVEQFVDTAVKHYSSGMYLRLAFAVAAHLEPEILLVDEVLAVGDAAFQKRCLGKIGEVAEEGRTVIFVSHNLSAVERLCDSALLLDHGRVTFQGSTTDAIERYLQTGAAAQGLLTEAARRPGRGRVRFTRVRALCDGRPAIHLTSGSRVELLFDYEVADGAEVEGARIRVAWTNLLGDTLFILVNDGNDGSGNGISTLPGPAGTVRAVIPRLPLHHGTYRLSAWIKSGRDLEDRITDALELTVAGGDFFGTGVAWPADSGPFLVPHSFEMGGER
ncbi:MAG: lipopolysaccharide transport system ATP-binding protein [Acidobacteriota bacterium]|jgi:lipopolysaccharide transport system ATP-binding protein|nr:lipopolysaccharide transport system ATP-binding protein [Acidobacteriota bacterium]